MAALHVPVPYVCRTIVRHLITFNFENPRSRLMPLVFGQNIDMFKCFPYVQLIAETIAIILLTKIHN